MGTSHTVGGVQADSTLNGRKLCGTHSSKSRTIQTPSPLIISISNLQLHRRDHAHEDDYHV
eukprot:scaffold12865_cov152-Skeletonema_menzelii.AAC.8